ncbi:uncharacterized protein si:dkey-65b12.12 isoform X1 [Erpetoichthys calabaricus]|uniref:uncharacterized protein si:dkey-65b12.12 isoform X1 n=1 Tax=Erpetoichthys calabaricus TaxID=27687 RepID=UPI002233F185|nr:uncharacterized protein si:dkey-65b12.12 isoform X1 [Erpetoichthys calabaricus]
MELPKPKTSFWILFFIAQMDRHVGYTCKTAKTKTTRVSAAVGSRVLMPCEFNITSLQKDRVTANWMYNTTQNVTRLVTISTMDPPIFWNGSNGRVQVYPLLSSQGNFSVLLSEAENDDKGLYVCELMKGAACTLGKQEILFSITTEFAVSRLFWYFLSSGCVACGITLVTAVIVCRLKRNMTCPGISKMERTPVDKQISGVFPGHSNSSLNVSSASEPDYENELDITDFNMVCPTYLEYRKRDSYVNPVYVNSYKNLEETSL